MMSERHLIGQDYKERKERVLDLSKLIEGKNLTDTETEVLVYMIEHIDDVMKMGVRGIAKANFTSTSTIMRLTKKLGYTGFIDMHYRLYPLVKGPENSQDTGMEFINGFCDNTLFQYNSYETLRGLAASMFHMSEKYIFIYATGFSAITAEYLYKKLLVLGRKCILASGMDSVGVFENNLDDIGLFITISKSGETKLVRDKLQTAKENGILTASVTGNGENTIGSLSDVWLKIEDDNKLDDRNTMANTFFPNVLLLIELLAYEYHKILLSENTP